MMSWLTQNVLKCGGDNDYLIHLISRSEYRLLTVNVSVARNGNPSCIFNLIVLPQSVYF